MQTSILYFIKLQWADIASNDTQKKCFNTDINSLTLNLYFRSIWIGISINWLCAWNNFAQKFVDNMLRWVSSRHFNQSNTPVLYWVDYTRGISDMSWKWTLTKINVYDDSHVKSDKACWAIKMMMNKLENWN